MCMCRVPIILLTILTMFSNTCLAVKLPTQRQISSDDAVFNIAIVAPFSGPYRAYGEQIWQGAEQAIKDLNRSHTTPSIFKAYQYDDQCNEEQAEKIAKLIAHHSIHAVIGHVCSDPLAAALPTYKKRSILTLTPAASSEALNQQHNPFFFRLTGSNIEQAQALAKFAMNKLNLSRIAVVHNHTNYGKELADAFIEQLVDQQHAPVLYQEVTPGLTDYSAIVEKFKNLNADGILFAGYYREVGLLAKKMYELKLQVPLLSNDGIANYDFLSVAGGVKQTSGVMFTFTQTTANLPSIGAHFQKHTGYTMHSYAAVQAIATAHLNTLSKQGKDLSKWLHLNKVNTILGKRAWNTNGEINHNPYEIFMWNKEGDYTVINTS